MAKLFSPEWLDELKSRCDIVDIIGRYVPLKKNGRELAGCCPFHHEKTASFFVYPESQSYHCFGCKESGDVIKYASCKNCESDCYLETCPKGSVCSLDDCSGLYCVTGCEVNYTNYCQQPNQDCDALGYYSMKPDCVGLEIIRCPFDTNMVYCFNSK